MKAMKNILGLVLAATIMLATGCGDDDGDTAAPLTVESITAAGTSLETGSTVTVDLNGATAASDVPEDAVITVTFNKELAEASVSSTTVAINGIATELQVQGSTVIVTPQEKLPRGTDLTVTLNGISAEDGGAFTASTRTFKTAGVAEVTPPEAADQVAYWSFNGNTSDETGNYSTANEIEVTYTEDRHGQVNSAIHFDGDTTLVEIAEGRKLMDTEDFTVSFWMKSNSSIKNDLEETRGQFVMGLAAWFGFQFEIAGNYGNCKVAASYSNANGNIEGEDLWWSTNGSLGWQGWTFDKDVSEAGGLAAIIADRWAHVVISYDATEKIAAMYMNGELVKSQDYDLYGEGHPMFNTTGMGYRGNDAPGDRLAFGFIQGSENRIVEGEWANPLSEGDGNHFHGELDDVRFFHASLDGNQVKTLYDAEKP